MSTDMQHYSIENQSYAILIYAARRGLTIVRSYEDAGRSGVRLDRRAGLQALLADVCSGRANFKTVLVYDVSRWGRFQDSDESAHYEYLCRQAGVSVEYCAEQFENDGSLTAALLKNIKRAMAGEYSRELSVKVQIGKSRLAMRGFHLGAPPGYGLRRMLVDEHRIPKGELRRGQWKSIQSDHVILVPGPPNELKTIKRIYRMFLDQQLSVHKIADQLTSAGIPAASGGAWTYSTVRSILSHEKYIGTAVYSQTSKLISRKWQRNPKDIWVRHEGAFQAVVPKDRFERACQRLAQLARPMTNNEMLDFLTALWCKSDHLSGRIVDTSKSAPSTHSYVARFGSMAKAFQMIGFKNRENYGYNAHLRKHLIAEMRAEIIRRGGSLEVSPWNKHVIVNAELRIGIFISRLKNKGPQIWQFGYRSTTKPDILLGARVMKRGGPIEDFFILPFMLLPHGVWITTSQSSGPRLDRFRSESLEPLYRLCARSKVEAPQWF
jgi:DNA invertase Pin-like site-specific DNA recombinase